MKYPSFKEALKFWVKLGWISFGGTAGHIALMHDTLVDKKKWISNSRFFHALSICMLLPGPEAQQLAIYIGQLLHGKKGGLAAGILFVLPSMFILLGLSVLYVLYGQVPWIYSLFDGLKPAVIAIIIISLVRVGRKSLGSLVQYLVAVAAFVLIFFYNVSLILIIMGAIAAALVIRYAGKGGSGNGEAEEKEEANEREYLINKFSTPAQVSKGWGEVVRQLAVFLLFWLAPLGLLYVAVDGFGFWKQLVFFFTQTAFFTIGGSYTVLPYVAQFAVGRFGWLSKMQMVDGFALAETTPGPLIIVVGFVGFMAGFNQFHSSVIMGSIALVVTVYYTFLPCFLYIFVGGPLIARSHGKAAIAEVLKVVTAAIVGVIANLVLFLGKGVVFPRGVERLPDVPAVLWVALSIAVLVRYRLNVVYLIVVSMLFGWLRYKLHF
ncbi:MAG: chromate efflux transporter [Bacteroidetes bacterium]|nr:chromate efflux transporter [Bacteroidota bacterium]